MTSLPKHTAAVPNAPARVQPSVFSELPQDVFSCPSAVKDASPLGIGFLNIAGTGDERTSVYQPESSTSITGLRNAEGYVAGPSETVCKGMSMSKPEIARHSKPAEAR